MKYIHRKNMNPIFKKIAICVCVLTAGTAWGQSQYEVIVNSAFSPVIRDAQKKMNFPAKIVDTVQFRPDMDYQLQIRPYQTTYQPEIITAPKVGKDQIERLYQHYLKVGLGYFQPLLEYDFGTLRSKKSAYGVHLRSHSSFDNVKTCGPSNFSNNELGLYGQQFKNHFVFSEQLHYRFDDYHCYGYLADSLEKTYGWTLDAKDIARYYHRAGASVKAYTNNDYSMRLHQLYFADYDFLYDNFGSFEHRSRFGTRLEKRFMSPRLDDFRVGGLLYGEYLHNDWDTTDSRKDVWLLHLNPYTYMQKSYWNLHLGFDVSLGVVNGESTVKLFPDVTAAFDVVPNILSFYTGVIGGMEQIDYTGLSEENPFLAPKQNLGLNNKYHFYAGTKTNLSRDLSFSAKVAVISYSGLPYFIPDTASVFINDTTSFMLQNTYLLRQTKALSTAVHLDLSYRFRDALDCRLNFDYNTYSTADSVTVYYKPHYIFSLDAVYSLKQKMVFGMNLALKGETYYPEFSPEGMSNATLANWFDWSLYGEYNWSRRLHFFAEFNNLLGRLNPMYTYYYTERFNCLFGLKYIFGGE